LNRLKNKPPNKVKTILKKSWMDLSNVLKDNDLESDAINIINKHLQTKYTSLNQINKADVKKMPTKYVYEDIVNEDFKHYWQLIKDEGFPVLAFYPGLSVWMELDKLLSGGDFNLAKTGVYAAFWLVLVSGKFLKGWEKWKKEKPEEFEKEGAKKNPFAVK